MPPSDTCPCGRLSPQRRPFAWADCCARYVEHFETTPAPDAESLMRSRYSAFVRERTGYLLATWHASTRPTQLEADPRHEMAGA